MCLFFNPVNFLSFEFFPNSEKRVGNTLYQELSFQDAEILKEVDDGADIPGTV